MRKLVWCGAALMVGCAVAVYMAADYATKHPDSYLGRCAAAAASLGARGNPFALAASMVNPPSGHFAPPAGAGVACGAMGHDVALEEQAAEVKPAEACEPEERVEMQEPEEAAEPVEPIRPEVLPEMPFPCDREDEQEGAFANGELVPLSGSVITPMQTEEPMPSIEVPGCMTPDEDTSEMIAAPLADEECPASCEYELMPSSPEASCEQSPCTGGGCCWLYRLIKFAGLYWQPAPEETVEIAVEEVEILPMPTECGDDDTEMQDEGTVTPETPEETTPETETPASQCPQNDSYHHHHDCCPYMGCPYPYSRAVPVVTPVETPRKVRTRKKPRESTSAKPASVEWVWKQLFGELTEMPWQTGIETLEFRPTDDVNIGIQIPY
jgi:hypothetical protein